MPEPLRCTILRSPAELDTIRDCWSSLYLRDPGATPFQSPEWLLPWWRHFGEGELRVLALRRGSSLIGLVPAYLYKPHQGPPTKLLPIGVSTSDYIDGIFAPECTPEDIAQALPVLLDQADWDELFFPQLRPSSKLRAAFAQLRSPGLEEHNGEATSRISAVPLSNLPQKLRKNFGNYRNRALREGSLDFVVSSQSEWQHTFSALCSLHAERWNHAGKTGVLADPRVLAWHNEAIPCMLQRGIARLSSVQLNGEMIAALYSLLDPPERTSRVQYCYLNGVSPEHAELSPGTLLLALTVNQAASEGIAAIDFLRGSEPYKQHWHPESLPVADVICRRS